MKLVEICAGLDAPFRSLLPIAAALTPYGVELRYDDDFWPDLETAKQARAAALKICDFIRSRLPKEMTEPRE